MCVEREGKKKKEETKTRFCVRKAKKTAGRVCVEREGKKKKKRQKKVLREEGEKDGLACVCVCVCVCVSREQKDGAGRRKRREERGAHKRHVLVWCFTDRRPLFQHMASPTLGGRAGKNRRATKNNDDVGRARRGDVAYDSPRAARTAAGRNVLHYMT